MSPEMNNKYRTILAAEEAFARRVALGVHVNRPLKVWRSLIPGMFIIDFLRRSSTIHHYSQAFLHPRNLALNAAHAKLQQEDEAGIKEQLESQVAQWLSELGLNGESLIKKQTEVVSCLCDHYLNLLRQKGETHEDLIRKAYPRPYQFKQFIETLTTLEGHVDQAILEGRGDSESLRLKLTAEKTQLALQREKLMDQIY